MTASWRPTCLVDARTRVERAYLVSAIADVLRTDDTWRSESADSRDRTARRFAFAIWAIQSGDLGRGDGGTTT